MALRQPYVEKVVEEIRSRGAEAPDKGVDTVYIGGGTPSLLKPEQMTLLLTVLGEEFDVADDAEISCEVNPGMVSERFLLAARAGGVNRISLGAQASQGALLSMLGRQHDWPQVVETVDSIKAAGITNINVDLMFGLPGQSLQQWDETLRKALDLQVTHLSCYGLIPEEGTPLNEALEQGRLSLPQVEEEREMYDRAKALLAAAGFEQYEISNFALPGYACRHNLGCWDRVPYLGFGCAAHSLVHNALRRQNPMTLQGYLQGEAPEEQPLPIAEQMFETMMLGLRKTEGVSLQRFEQTFGESIETVYNHQLSRSLQRKLLVFEQGFLRLTERGMDVMNTVLLDLMETYRIE